ncbi:hypothetical protein [Nocardioides sp. Root140]|uniref:hypothetical protein n=1 Tax=Nocardioides sp. Root140 TaxID=1736460 RepID=UPI000714AFE0|nr:hypothetical protein [Nocardioides sp. Root140]KQY61838.1 hypothetical protein ASD30_25180 [Nocardioides sp. Root140]
MTAPNKFMTVREAAALFELTPKGMRELLYREEVPLFNTGRIRIERALVLALYRKCGGHLTPDLLGEDHETTT